MAARTGDGPIRDGSTNETTPEQLAAAWKKGGGFDSLRKQLLAEFLSAPQKDKFLADLDVSLPALLASTPSIARQERKDRPNAVIRSMKQIETLRPQIKATEKRLREDDAIASRIDRELARSLCQIRGVPFVEPEETKAAVSAEVPRESAGSVLARAADGPQPDPAGSIMTPHSNGEVTLGAQVKTEGSTAKGESVSQRTPGEASAVDKAEQPAPPGAPAADGLLEDAGPTQRTPPNDVDASAVEAASSGVKPEEEANASLPSGDGDNDDVEMKPAVPDAPSGPA
ncbi:hypothetical protein JCM3774_001709 [Rhodotorula dairenensis]